MKIVSFARFALSLTAIASMFVATQARAETVILNAIQDTWVSQNTTQTTVPQNNTRIDVRGGSNSANSTTTKRYGVFEFDLSSVTDQIIGATLQLYMLPGTPAVSNTGTATTSAVGLPLAAHIDEATLTWTGTNAATTRADMLPVEVVMQDLGRFTYTAPGTVPEGAYYASNAASASDVLFVEGQRNSASKLIGFLLNPNSTTNSSVWHQWSDHESGFAAQLVLTTVPEPSAVVLSVMAIPLAMLLYRRKSSVP